MRIITLTCLLLALPAGAAEFVPDTEQPRQVAVAETIAALIEEQPETAPYFEEAYAYVVWPTIVRASFGFGGAYGKGLVIREGEVIAGSSYYQFTGGIQAGVKGFGQVLFFQDEESFVFWRDHASFFMGQAGLDLATWGVSGTPGYDPSVALFARTKLGLAFEASYSGVWFSYSPVGEEPSD